MQWIEALILGAVQGVTEFLPISSDGHLVLFQQVAAYMSGKKRSGAEDLFFDLMLHLGTLAAVVIFYRAVVKTGAKGLLGSTEVPPTYRRGSLIRTGLLVIVATLPLVPLKLFLMKYIKLTFESLTAAGIGFLITAAVLLLSSYLQRKGEEGKGPAEMTFLDALLIGIAQTLAPLPGVSRSGMTIASALGLGLSRAWAVGFSLLIMVPAVGGGAFLEILEALLKKKTPDAAPLSPEYVSRIIAAAILAGIVGYGAILWLVRIVRSGKMWYFSVYLIILGLAVLLAAPRLSTTPGARSDGRPENAALGALRRASADTGARNPGRASKPLDRAHAPGAASDSERADRAGRPMPDSARLVLD
jgi:undecaprenyl-diphosphatase